MPRKKTKLSPGKSPMDAPDWYATPEGRAHTKKEFARALRAGTVLKSEGRRVPKSDPKLLQQLMEQAKASATQAISIRIPIADLERAKQIAGATGTGYQSVLKKVIHEGLLQAD